MKLPLLPDRRERAALPLLEVEESRQEVRRVSRRIRVPAAFYHMTESGEPRALELSLFSSDDNRKLADCMLYDVNDEGIAFASPDILNMDLQGILTAYHPDEDDPVMAAEVTVVNERGWNHPSPEDLPEAFKQCTEMFVYGARVKEQGARGFIRLVLESLAISMSRGR